MNTRQNQTERRGATFRRIVVVTTGVVAVVTFGAGATPAAAFEPPADPNNNFTCDGGPVAGHPGHRGLAKAMTRAASPTAWNAVDNADPITLCG